MRASFVASEHHPLNKAGGRAAVSAALPAALAEHMIEIRELILGCPEALDRAELIGHAVPVGKVPGEDHAHLLPARSDFRHAASAGRLSQTLTQERGTLSGLGRPELADNAHRFAAHCHAAAHAARDAVELTWQPDLIRTRTISIWGLVLLLLNDAASLRTPVYLTIHNLAFRGLFAAEGLPRLGVPVDAFSPEGIEFKVWCPP